MSYATMGQTKLVLPGEEEQATPDDQTCLAHIARPTLLGPLTARPGRSPVEHGFTGCQQQTGHSVTRINQD